MPSLSPASDVSAKFGSCSASSPGGPTPMSPASTGSVGARQAPSRSAAAVESPSRVLAEQRDRRDRERHREQEQPRGGAPGAPRQGPVELEPGREQRHHDGDLGQVLEQPGIRRRVGPAQVARVDRRRGGDAEPEVDEGGREGALALMRERADRGEDGQADEEQADRERIARVEPAQAPGSGAGSGVGSSGRGDRIRHVGPIGQGRRGLDRLRCVRAGRRGRRRGGLGHDRADWVRRHRHLGDGERHGHALGLPAGMAGEPWTR